MELFFGGWYQQDAAATKDICYHYFAKRMIWFDKQTLGYVLLKSSPFWTSHGMYCSGCCLPHMKATSPFVRSSNNIRMILQGNIHTCMHHYYQQNLQEHWIELPNLLYTLCIMKLTGCGITRWLSHPPWAKSPACPPLCTLLPQDAPHKGGQCSIWHAWTLQLPKDPWPHLGSAFVKSNYLFQS